MSRDDPFDRGGKTVIRPNPGGGAGGGPRGPDPGPGRAPWPPLQLPAPGYPPQQPGYPPPPQQGGYNPRVNPPMPQPGGAPAGRDDWLSSPAQGQNLFPERQAAVAPAPTGPKIPLEVALNAREGSFASSNPITAAAAPLLILLGRLRLGIVDMQAVPLMQHVATQIEETERKMLAAGVSPDDARAAKYALAATADDIVQNLPGTDRAVWLRYSMVAQFFQDRTSGVRFYEGLSAILQNPGPRYNLLELMHVCLSLGFEGQYRGSPNGSNELQRIRRATYETLRHLKAPADEDISPRWRGLELKMASLTSRVPVWAIGAAAAAILVAVFFLLRILLGNNADLLADRLVALHPAQQITLDRPEFVPAKEVVPDVRDPTQLERIRTALAEQIREGDVVVNGVSDQIVVSVNNVLLFESGSATVKNEFGTLAGQIAAALQNEPGPINVIGHTDSVKPSSTARFKSNYDLSVARAEGVSDVMAGLISDPSRLTVDGRGELDPIADNATPEGRAQNRRVEIMIPREETLNL